MQAHTRKETHTHTDTQTHTHVHMNVLLYTHICVHTHVVFPLHTAHTQGAGRHLQQAGQANEDALRHARQLVPGQIKVPVGMAEMS